MKRWLPAIAAGAVLAIAVFAGFAGGKGSGDNTASAATGGEVAAGQPLGGETGLTVPATTLPPVEVETVPPVQKTQLAKPLSKGMYGDDVKAVQQRLIDFGFDPGGVDGAFGGATQQAVWAFEGLVLGLKYDQQTGVVTNDLWQRMQDQLTFPPRRPLGAGTTHMEIYLDTQLAIVFKDDKPRLITHISSGQVNPDGTPFEWCDTVTYNTDRNGAPLPEPVEKAECGRSKTPGGVFKFNRRYDGNRQSPLGGMWNPVYFNYGIAVHGAINVPNHPASHGCIRIPMFIADYFPSLVANGDRVYVWDGKKEPENQSKNDMSPIFNYPDPNATTTTSSTTTTTLVTTTTAKSTTTTTVRPTTTTSAAPPPATTAAPAVTTAPPTDAPTTSGP